jgi:Copper transport outer membrane protein, MctB
VIDFRYHLVSIIAIFLALAVGLVVGATSLSGPVETALSKAEKAVSDANNNLRAHNDLLKRQASNDQAFAQAGSDRLVGGLLTGEDVAVIAAPNVTSSMTSGVISTLEQAGAKVTAQVQLQPNFVATAGPIESSLTDLARGLSTQFSISLPSSPLYPAEAGQQQAAALIAASVVSKNGIGLPVATSSAILSGFASRGFLQVVKAPSAASPATVAVLLTSAGALPTPQSQALVAVAAELKPASAATVMAGGVSPVNASNAVTVEASVGTVSTVDNADTETGEIIVAQALRELLDGKPVAAYGIEPGTVPSPAPTPSSTSTSAGGSPSSSGSPSTSRSPSTSPSKRT